MSNNVFEELKYLFSEFELLDFELNCKFSGQF